MGVFKSRTDRQALRVSAQAAGLICDTLITAAQPGVSTVELEAMANRLLAQHRSTAPFRLFDGFNHAACISLNDEIVNGPPSRNRVLSTGDLVSIAVGTCIKGIHGKAARTAYLGEPSPDIQRLLTGTREILTFSEATPSLKALLENIPRIARKHSLSVIQNGGGCGIGRQLHEAPGTPNDPGSLSEDLPGVNGLAFTLMPMMSLGPTGEWTLHEDGWTQVTADGELSAHFADTFLWTEEAGLENLSVAP